MLSDNDGSLPWTCERGSSSTRHGNGPSIKGIPKWFFCHVFFWRPEVPRPNKTHVSETSGFLAVPPKAASPNNHSFVDNVWLFGFGTPGLQKTTWPQNHFGILLTYTRSLMGSAAPQGSGEQKHICVQRPIVVDVRMRKELQVMAPNQNNS